MLQILLHMWCLPNLAYGVLESMALTSCKLLQLLKSPLHLAAKWGHRAVAMTLIKEQANVEAPDLVSALSLVHMIVLLQNIITAF